MALTHKNVTFHIINEYSHDEKDHVKGHLQVRASFFSIYSDAFTLQFPWNDGPKHMNKDGVLEKLKNDALKDLNAKVEAAFAKLNNT
jgi:hypothetical protein